MGQPTVSEQARELPVRGGFDVLVAGGGMAGVSAAVSAARNGASVCLIEKACCLGGLATLGVVTIWLPLCDGRGRQVIAGLPEELLKLSVSDLTENDLRARFVGVPSCWLAGGDTEQRKRTRYRAEFNPSSYLLALEELLIDEGVSLLYDTRVCGVAREGGRIGHVIVENKQGRSALACLCVIDATGDADVCFLAGERTESLDTNVPAGWFYHLSGRRLVLNKLSNPYCPRATKEDAVGPFHRADRAEEVTEHLIETRRLIRARLAEIRAEQEDGDVQPVLLPTIPCFRMTRRLVGAFSLNERHVNEWFDDTIGLTGDWREPGPVYALPFRAIAGQANRNLLAVGRCISADRTVWDVTRAIPACTVTGAAAGTAAAMASQNTGGDLAKLSMAEMRERLTEQGALIDPALVKQAGR